MLEILAVSDSCLTVLGVIFFIKELIKYALILIPIGLIVILSIDFTKGVISFQDGKDNVINLVIRRIIYTVVIFLIPTTIFGVFSILGLAYKDSESCWAYADKSSVSEIKKAMENKQKEEEKASQKIQKKISKRISKKAKTQQKIKTIVDSDSNSANGAGAGISNNQKAGNGVDWNDLTKVSGLSASELTKKLNSSKDKNLKYFANYANNYVSVESNYGVNAIFLIALEAHESAYMRSKTAIDCNNLGGVSGKPKCPNHRWRKFDSKDEFIDYHGKLLGKKYLKSGGSYYHGKNLEGIKESYCPSSDSSCSSWLGGVKKVGNALASA